MEKVASTVGIVASALVAVSVLLPYLVLPTEEAAGLGTYYGYGIVGPWVVLVGALVAAFAFAGGRQERTDPVTVAGVTVAIGVFLPLIALQWALAVDLEVVLSITTATWMEHHRWVVLGTTLPVPVAAAWYAWALDLV